MQRWGISESRLPPGSEIHFRSLTVWDQYKWQIMLVVAIILAQTASIIGLIYEHRRRTTAEANLLKRVNELAHLNRIATVSELSASIAHEINQPLGAIVSNANAALRWLSGKTPNLEEVVDSLKRIASDGHRASDVIGTVRAMVKHEAQDRTPQDINDVITEVLTFLRTELDPHHMTVRFALSQNLPPVLVDRVQLQQVILNLIINAIDAMNAVPDRENLLRIRTEATNDGEVVISIEDNGTGIDPANLDRIFEPFFTTKSKGMGMGLSICRSIVEAYGGTLSAAPAREHGSVFQITLPAEGS